MNNRILEAEDIFAEDLGDYGSEHHHVGINPSTLRFRLKKLGISKQ